MDNILRDVTANTLVFFFSLYCVTISNSTLYDSYLEGRDSGLFGAGAVVVIQRPSSISGWMGGNLLPTIDVPGSFDLVDPAFFDNHPLRSVPIDKATLRMQGFCLPRVKIALVNLHLITSPCGGNFCDSLQVYSSDGEVASHCACFHSLKRMGNVLFLFTLQVHLPDGSSIHVRNFSSKRFTQLFLRNGVPSGLSASMVNQNPPVLRSVIRNVKRAFNLINDTTKFCVVGWSRKGMMHDELTDGPGVDDGRVLSSETTFHLSSVNVNGCDLDGVLTDLGALMASENESTRVIYERNGVNGNADENVGNNADDEEV